MIRLMSEVGRHAFISYSLCRIVDLLFSHHFGMAWSFAPYSILWFWWVGFHDNRQDARFWSQGVWVGCRWPWPMALTLKMQRAQCSQMEWHRTWWFTVMQNVEILNKIYWYKAFLQDTKFWKIRAKNLKLISHIEHHRIFSHK